MGESIDNLTSIKVIQVSQPISRFYCGVMRHTDLARISFADSRRINTERERCRNVSRDVSRHYVRRYSHRRHSAIMSIQRMLN